MRTKTLSLLLLLFILPAACSGQEEATPTPLPTATTEAAAGTEETWARIQANGRMVVGVAADYPPFAYYNENFQLEGLDIALINEIADRMGVAVEIRDMAFDGLGNGLRVGQIDIAIAAISVTPERDALFDFTNPYFITEDAALAVSDSGITIEAVTDLVGYRIGVQSGSVYETWLRQELVAGGLIPARDLHVYQNTDGMVQGLTDGLLDVAIGDLPPAEVAAGSGALEIVGQGLNQQRFGIALPQGEPTLRQMLNDALLQLQNEGVVTRLAAQYLQIDEGDVVLAPPDPAQPTPTPPAAASGDCIDSMRLVQHLNYDDNNMSAPPLLAPGAAFTKGWRIENTGACTWDNSYLLVPVGGNDPAARMGGQATAVSGSVGPGETVAISVDLTAPLTSGVYQGFWTMRSSDGLLFGDRLSVGITVENQPTLTPMPTQTPAPDISYTVTQTNIQAGACVTFRWSVENANAVYFSTLGEPWESNQVAAQGERVECPPRTTTFEMRVVKPDESMELRQLTVYVSPVPGAPSIDLFTTSPPQLVAVGQCVRLQWQVSGEVSQVNVLRNNATVWTGMPLSGAVEDCPPGSGRMIYTLEAVGPQGTSRQQRDVNVVEVITATPLPPGPVINTFTAVPSQMRSGQCVTISWDVGGDAARIEVKRDNELVMDNVPFFGRIQQCLNDPGVVTYRLEATNQAGVTSIREATVTVSGN